MKTLFFIFTACFLSSFLHATIINVLTPYATIQLGIDAAANGDIVLVQPGTYVENINYNGKLITVGSLFLTTQNTSYIFSTTINGNNSGSVVTFNHNENPNAVLCGFTIENGSNDYGGGIYCYGSSPSLENVTISSNSANIYGGGIYCNNSSPSLENVTTTSNSASYGGGIFCYGSSSSLENVTISSNSANNSGGGIFCQNSNLTLINSILWFDTPQEIYISSGSVTATYSDIQGGWTGTGNIDSDPLFVNPGIGDYHLQLISPCIDAGDPASPLDPDGTIVEMGAYYFPQLPPEADFTTDTTNGYVPLTVNFTDLSTQGTGVIDEWYWDFGDGNNSSLQNPVFEYLLPGVYTVSLTVTDFYDSTDTEIKVDYITVDPLPPIADFTANTTNGYTPLTVNFTDLSTQGTGVIDEWYWDFGDGNNSFLQDPTNEYLLPGVYTVSLTVTDFYDSTDTETKVDYITVDPLPPIADFTADITNGEVPLTVSFTDLSTQGSGVIDEWYWDFGDGNNSSLQNPSNEYLLPGDYTVSLTVTDVNDSTDTEIKVDYITVNPPAYSGPVWHISTTGSDVWGNGSTQYPFATIQHGIDTIADTDTVLVQPGTYMEHINYNGKLITIGSLFLTTQDTTYISQTIIDGNQIWGLSVVTFENSEDSTAILCGITITNGYRGIYCYNSSPSFKNLTITGNSANFGGGIRCLGSNSSLVNVTITSNTASLAGGGIVCSYSSNLSLENVTITGNTADDGGGIWCSYFSSLSLENVIITDNSVGGDGGGIYSDNCILSMENTTVSGNTAYTGGGIDCRNNSILNLDVVKIVSNSASGYGGGIRCENSSPSLVNVTISGNFSGSNGGGIFFAGSDPVIINSILWNDYPQEIYFHSGSATATYSDIQGGWAGTGNIDSNPFFVDSSNGDYHLRSTSPCIDSGDPSSPLDPDSSRVDMGAYYFNQSIGAPAITAVTDVSNDQGRSVIVTWQRSIWDQALSITPIVGYNLWEKYPFELDRKSTVTNDINKAIEEQNTYFQREDTTWVLIANVFAMQWEEYSVNAVTYLDSTIAGDYLSYFFVSAHTPSPWIYFSSSVESGYSVDNIAPDETRVYIVQNGSNIALNWDEVEYGTFQGNSYLEINGIWYKIYAGDSPDFVCDEAHLIDTVTDLNYDYPLSGEERSSSRS